MLLRNVAWVMALSCSGLLGLSADALFTSARAFDARLLEPSPAEPPRMLTGAVRSASGDALGGVTVSARSANKTLTTSVFTDEAGTYVFPALDGGAYVVWAQAVGFDAARAEVNVDSGQALHQDFTLRAVKDFTMQLSGSQWMAALPDDTFAHRRMKQLFQVQCTSCHVPQFVLQNRFDEKGWRAIITAMETFGSTGLWSKKANPVIQHHKEEMATYLAEMRGPAPSPMKFEVPTRPHGEAARVVITEYDVPPAETPDQLVPHDGSVWSEGAPSAYWAKGLHDTVPDLDGNAWINDSVTNKNRTYAKVDAKTGKVTNFAVPGGGDGFVRGSHSMAVGPDGIIWMDLYPGHAAATNASESGGFANDEGGGASAIGESLARLDPKTLKLDIFDPPKTMAPMADFVAVDGKNKVWAVTRTGALRFDPDTKQFTEFKVGTVGNYDVAGDLDGNGWWAGIAHDKLGAADVKTGKSTEITIPARKEMMELVTPEDREFYRSLGEASTFGNNIGTPWAQAPRRLGADPKNPILWAADWFGQNIAEVNTRTHKVTYHRAPDQYSSPYDTDVDNDGIVWVSLRNAEAVGKFNPRTQQWTTFTLPTQGVEARQISVDRIRGEVWLPYWRTSKVARLQFRTEQQMRSAISR